MTTKIAIKIIVIKTVFLAFIITTMISCQLGRYIWYGKGGLNDHKIFYNKELHANNSQVFKFPKPDTIGLNLDLGLVIEKHNWLIETKDIGEYPLVVSQESFESFLESKETVAFLIIRRDTILYERYFDDYTVESIVPSFSMAKSFTSILIGCAIDDGLIQSVDEPVTNYVPELKNNGFDKVSIKNLLQMTSGIDFKENYSNPFGDVANLYYGTNLRKTVGNFKLKTEPGKRFYYNSGESQLLGLVLDRALKNQSITQYMQEKIWTPIGMEHNASWSLDSKKNGLEKTYCCINASAIDFAKIGRLYLNKGNWNGQQIVSEQWVNESIKIDTSEGSDEHYQYQWLVSEDRFTAQGVFGQILYVNPSKELIVIRLGKDRGNVRWDIISDAIALLLE
jgi:CubicO group peptidase (beta-lactamase class C family)